MTTSWQQGRAVGSNGGVTVHGKYCLSALPIAPTRSYAAAAYLQSIGFNQRVFLIGNEGVAEELEAASIDYVTLEQLCAAAAGSGDNGSSNANGVASSAAALQQQWTAEGLAKLQVGWLSVKSGIAS